MFSDIMEFKKIREGRADLLVPETDLPEHARAFGFYNPEMETDRDISVGALSVFRRIFQNRSSDPEKEIEVCDLLCATGVRGIRYKKEVGGILTINDVNEKAIELAKKNVELNGVEIEILNSDANLILSERFFDFIDIDPFGSPYPFLDSAARSLSGFGMLYVTATDTAALFGVYPEVSERRYGIPSKKCDFDKELGTRILASFVIRELAKYNLCFTPVLCYSRRHYVRLMGIVEKSAEKVESLMKNFDFLSVNAHAWKTGSNPEAMDIIGRIYMGKLYDYDFCSKILEELRKRKLHGEKILTTLLNECDALFYHETDWLSENCGIRMKIHDLIFELQKAGFVASRTMFSDTGIKTNAMPEDIEKVFENKKEA
jgi:tRNA (guanine26-N2/guanine27-N2)-dimethyltransferase